ncbi:MAG TPA: DUF1302 family protein [Anaeromyxobacteraceae bacterium]|nr:DUF1302 family protein [Anaeromyxobacteraceae bacterium]
MKRRHVVAALAMLSFPGAGGAFEFPTGASGLVGRFDNTFRYNLGVRTGPIDTLIGANPVFTAGEYCVEQGGFTTNRLDLLSEFDLSYLSQYGVRVTAAAWYDYAYHSGEVHRSPALEAAGVPGTYYGDMYSTYTLRRYRGPWGELLDAFAFATVDAGSVPITVKVGRHALYWGEALMLSGAIHSVSYSQTPLDLQKAFATPGVEAKEFYRPLTNVSVQAQLTPALSLAGQFFLEWQSYLYPEGGTFLGPVDFAFYGPDYVSRAGVVLTNSGASRPPQIGEWGVALRYGPEWLDGTVGLYYRRYTDKLPSVLIVPGVGGPPTQYRQFYAEGVGLVGLSLSKQVAGMSLGAEVSFRYNAPLLAPSLGAVSPTARFLGNTYQARGETLHALMNLVGVVPPTFLFSTASWAVELTYSRWLAVTDNADMFFGQGYGLCRGDVPSPKSRQDGCATRDEGALGATFAPTWFRVTSGVDLLAPLAVSWTMWGNAVVPFGGNQGSGTYGLGIAADVDNQYRFDLRYVDFFGQTTDNGKMVTSSNGLLALLKSRGSVTFTAKATF